MLSPDRSDILTLREKNYCYLQIVSYLAMADIADSRKWLQKNKKNSNEHRKHFIIGQ